MPKSEDIGPVYVKGVEIAQYLDLTPRRVSGLIKEGVLPRMRTNGFDLRECVRAYVQYLRSRAGVTSPNLGGGSIGDHRERLIKARADLAEMEAAQLAGQLIRADLAETVWSEASSRVRQRMLSVAPKAAPVVAVETSAEVCHETIEAFVHEALAELAGVTVQVSEFATEGDQGAIQDTGPTSEADDIAMGGSEPEAVE